jgi:hypothetical protein
MADNESKLQQKAADLLLDPRYANTCIQGGRVWVKEEKTGDWHPYGQKPPQSNGQ